MTSNVLSTSSFVKHADHSMYALLLRDSTLDGIIIKTVKERQFFHQHFLSEGHHGLVNDWEIPLIDKTHSSDSTRQEFFWIRLLKT